MANKKSIGLKGGPNEFLQDITQYISVDGYKRYSEDVSNPYNVIESGNITMKDVDFPVLGTDNLGSLIGVGRTYGADFYFSLKYTMFRPWYCKDKLKRAPKRKKSGVSCPSW